MRYNSDDRVKTFMARKFLHDAEIYLEMDISLFGYKRRNK